MSEINENKRRVIIDENGKMTIYNDNATITADSTSYELTGDYHIGADSILRLLANAGTKSYLKERVFYTGHWDTLLLSKDEDILQHFDKMESRIKATYDTYEEKIKRLEHEIDRLTKLQIEKDTHLYEARSRLSNINDRINSFNSTRHWWERKLKIKE
jgi:hypothetical protein